MAKYCRYCSMAYLKPLSCVWCVQKNVEMSKKQAKHTNECEWFTLNTVDVLRENTKGYIPSGKQIVQHGGLGKQIRMEELLNDSKAD